MKSESFRDKGRGKATINSFERGLLQHIVMTKQLEFRQIRVKTGITKHDAFESFGSRL